MWDNDVTICAECARCGWDISEHESGPTRPRPLSGCIRFVPVDSGLQGSRHVPGDGANATTRGPGRPRIDDKRSPRGGFNDAEWAKVKALAKAEGMTASAWVRARCGL